MIRAVIGAAYGDEGKGCTVNDLATPASLVVRFNGGAQAGHTVCHDGKRHVFSHIGAGFFKGAATHLSRFFVCHPILFFKECMELDIHPAHAKVSVSPDCFITSPLDVYFNHVNSKNLSHGTVGVGFGETIERCEQGYGFTVGPSSDYAEEILREWAKVRSGQLNVNYHDTLLQDVLDRIKDFLGICKAFSECVKLKDDDCIEKHNEVIFEGAQGLMLDMDHPNFPHVTRSKTGMHNIRKLTTKAVTTYYVMRAYTTRHGAGPLPYELPCKPYRNIVDETNTDDGMQGVLRYAPLNLDDIRYTIQKEQADFRINVITCMDQVPDFVDVIYEGHRCLIQREELRNLVSLYLKSPTWTRYHK